MLVKIVWSGKSPQAGDCTILADIDYVSFEDGVKKTPLSAWDQNMKTEFTPDAWHRAGTTYVISSIFCCRQQRKHVTLPCC